jgi:hypothetical protein
MKRISRAAALGAILLFAAVPITAGAVDRGPRFSAPIFQGLPDDPVRIVAGDLNGDGNADLASVNWNSSSVSVLFSRGDGNFDKRIDLRAPRHPSGIAIADVDGDRRSDLITAGHDQAGSVAVWLNGGAGRLVRAGTYDAGSNAWALVAGDVNGDGVTDLLTAHHGRQQLGVLLGIGDGRFHGAQRYRGRGSTNLALGDLNRDGHPDVVLGTRGKADLAVRLGRGDGTFGDPRNYKTGAGDSGIAVADLNHDQILDVAAGGGDISVMLGSGDGTLHRGWHQEGVFGLDAVTSADLDGDTNADLLASGYPPSILVGDGKGQFVDVDEDADDEGVLDFDGMTGSGTIGDFNADGRPDLALISFCDYDCHYGTVVLWLNWTGLPGPPCVVPAVTDILPIAGTLRDAGCRLGHVSHRFSRSVEKGWAISQHPKPGVVLPSRSGVDVVISRGRRHRRH